MDKSLDNVIFLLGAGASVDAGMPDVAQLTEKLKNHPEFVKVFYHIAQYDSLVLRDYERLFQWIRLILDVQKDPFRNVIRTQIDPSLICAMADLALVVGAEISKILSSCETSPDYFASFRQFLTPKRRLKVFTLNYDCCLEDACRSEGIEVTTGFDPGTHMWNPSLFQRKKKGINLYKLHGSLRWFRVRDDNLHDGAFDYAEPIRELRPEDVEDLPSTLTIHDKPELVLGPGDKIQPDDPFLTLMYEFKRSLEKSKVCVIIGYGHKDDHVNVMLGNVFKGNNLKILDVNPDHHSNRYLEEGEDKKYIHLRKSAECAFLSGAIENKLESML